MFRGQFSVRPVRATAIASIVAVTIFAGLSATPAHAMPEILYYPLNEGTGTTTQNMAVPGQGTPSFVGTVNWVNPAQFGAGINTTSGHINSGWNTELSNSFTLEMWMRITHSSIQYFAGDNPFSSYRMFTGGVAGNGIYVRGGGMTDTITGTNINTGNWFHFAFVYDSSVNETHLYINGNRDATVMNQFPVGGTSGTTFLVGSYNGTSRWAGDIDEVRLWSQARTESEINQFMNVEFGGTPDLEVDLEGPNTVANVESDSDGSTGDGELLADFTIRAMAEDWTVTSIEFTVNGTGDGSTAFSEIALYEDDGNDIWDGAGVDTLATATAGTAFSGPNGTYTATLSDPDFPAYNMRRFFLVGILNGSASAGETFEVAVTDVVGTSTGGGVINGVPTAFSAGLEINEARLAATYHGPFAPQPYPFDATGPHGDGILMLAVSFAASNEDFSIDQFELRAFGSGNASEHFEEVAIYHDNGSDTWDGAAVDSLLVSTASFPSSGVWNAALSVSIPRASSERFYVVAKLNGMAPNGVNFGIAMDGITVSSPATFQLQGMPFSSALSINILTPTTIDTFSPTTARPDGGDEIVITGTGLSLPISVQIGDEMAEGEAQVNGNGTEVSGLVVPQGHGRILPITVTVGGQTFELTESFSYETIGTGGASGCAAPTASTGSTALAVLLALGLLGLIGCRRLM